ncbi:MAG: hypothetical protein Q9170_007984 [Blastenia crenularia]
MAATPSDEEVFLQNDPQKGYGRGIKIFCEQKVRPHILSLPRNFLSAAEFLVFKEYCEHFASGQQAADSPPPNPRKRGRPGKERPSLESNATTIKRSWAQKLEDSIDTLALHHDVQQLIETNRKGTHTLDWLKKSDPPTSVSEGFISPGSSFLCRAKLTFESYIVQRLFRLLLLADIAKLHGVQEKSRIDRGVQLDMEANFDKVDVEGKKIVGFWMKDTLKGDHDGFQKELELAFRLASFCNQHGPASILYFIGKITKKGNSFEKAKLVLNTLGLGEKAESSGAKHFAKQVRTRLLHKIQADDKIISLSSAEEQSEELSEE